MDQSKTGKSKIKLKLKELPEPAKLLISPEINKLRNELELREREKWIESEGDFPYLYPSLNDPLFNVKIAEKKEFNNTKYDGTIYKINEQAEKLCNSEFELSPHQQFIKNFLSFQTPYNSLLVYHGLGTGKTCSAIGVAEEMRDYINQIGIEQQIIVVASPNVQSNFRTQLFDESKLNLEDGMWNLKSCIGNKLLKEINPMNTLGLSREKVRTLINHLINDSYLFWGYTQFANEIEKISDVGSIVVKNKAALVKSKLKQFFDNRLIIIDEVHNVRKTDDTKDKRVADELEKLVQNVNNLRLLLLSATPLYNNYKEIIWLINLMNMNDGRSVIDTKDVFDSEGNFKVNKDGDEVGKELLERKAIGYISFVRGDNPYIFPYRIWPDIFAPTKTLQNITYPVLQLNGNPIIQDIEHLSIYLTNLGSYQQIGYDYIIDKLNPAEREELDKSDRLGYIILQRPLEALNMIYPNPRFSETEENTIDIAELVGKNGLRNVMNYTEPPDSSTKTNFEYKSDILDKYGRIFSQNEIGKYSGKIKTICENIMHSEGVILVYSGYLDGGVVPVALALEEMGITRYSSVKSLFKTPPVQNLDLNTYTNTNSKTAISAKYIMITGDIKFSPNNNADLHVATQKNNTNGEKVKVILITQAGAEGLDFKFIRQVHILEPWYNLSRIEQIIGRAVRHCSHKDLPFEKRNVELFLHGSILEIITDEAADLYVYRFAELKATKIGKISRVLKEVAVDCLLNSEQLNFTIDGMQQKVVQILSNGEQIEYVVGDKPYSAICDYMESCDYKCSPQNTIGDVNIDSYSEFFIEMNSERIIHRIRQIMKEGFFYEKNDLIKQINIVKPYDIVQIYAALNQMVTDKNEFITDKYGRLGTLVNIGEYYFFQPLELTGNLSLYERKVPIPFKHENIPIKVTDEAEILLKDIVSVDKTIKTLGDAVKDPTKLSKIAELEEKVEGEKVEQIVSMGEHPGKQIMVQMLNNYTISTNQQSNLRGDTGWYKYSAIVLNNLKLEGIESAILEELLISHIIESLLFNDVLNVLNYIYNKETLTPFEELVKNYFEYHLLENKDVKGLLLQTLDAKSKKAEQMLVVLNGTNWVLGESEDYNDLKPNIEKIIQKPLNNTIGFLTSFNNQFMIFKIRQTDKAGYTGARCDQASKLKYNQINSIIGTDKYTAADLKKIPSQELCILFEYLLRLNDYNDKDSVRWFLTPGEAAIINRKK